MAPPDLDILPVEILREIYQYVLCPGTISILERPSFDQSTEGRRVVYLPIHNCNTLGYNRVKNYTQQGTPGSRGRLVLAEGRKFANYVSTSLSQPSGSRYLDYQKLALKERLSRKDVPPNLATLRPTISRMKKEAMD